MVVDFLFGFQPVLDVAPAELGSFEAQRFATDERDGLRLYLAEMAGGEFAVHKCFGGGVPKNDMGEFVKCGFVRERGKRIYGNLPLPREPLNVSVYFVKRYARYTQSTDRRIHVETGNRHNVGFFPFGLCEDKPIGAKPEGVTCLWFLWFFLRVVSVRGSLEWHWHTEGDSCLPLADLPFAFKPTAIGVKRSGLQVASNALFECKQGIPDAVVVKCGVGFEHSPWLFNRIAQEFPQVACCLSCILLFLLFFRFSSVVFA